MVDRDYCGWALSIAVTLTILFSISAAEGQTCDFSRFKPFKADYYPEAAVLRREAPKYPALAKKKGIHGVVAVKVLVNGSGRVVRACLIRGEKVFRAAAEAAARRWLFKEDSLNIIKNDEKWRRQYIELVLVFDFKAKVPSPAKTRRE